MKAFILFLILIPIAFYPQDAGQKVFTLYPALGINGCQVHGDNYSGYNKFGLFAGVAVDARLNKKTSLQLGFYFSQKGARHNPNSKTGDLSYYRLNINYIDLPLCLRYYANSNYYLTAGPSVAYFAGYNENINYTNMTGFYTYNKFEVGLNAGLGRKINDHWSVELRTSNSITPIRNYGLASNVYYSNPVARFFNKGFYNNILTLFVSYTIDLTGNESH